jgi:magnesium transporter
MRRPVEVITDSRMISYFIPHGSSLERFVAEDDSDLPEAAVWIDLINPTASEDRRVERLGVALPTREEMQEIEVSSRLYVENGARFMTATMMCQSDTDAPQTTPVTFILAGHRLITVRYEEPRPFAIVRSRLGRVCAPSITGEGVLLELLDAVIDRAADILERVSAEVDRVSRAIFDASISQAERSAAYASILQTIGSKGDLTSKGRESLVSIGRLVLFLANEADTLKWAKDQRAQVKSMQRDVASLSDHATYLTNKITFLLDAMVGVVTIEQNNIIKTFSVAAVILLPPTTIASIYGMNFRHMPELDWTYGYPFAIFLMILAAVLPYLYFKWRKWL